MTQPETELILRMLTEVVSGGDLDLIDDLVHPDFFDHEALPSRASGPAGLRATVQILRDSFAGFRLEPRDVIAADGKVVVRATASGRHVGELNGIPPTGRECSAEQIHIFRLAEGKLIEHWAVRDDLGTLRQLGLLAHAHQAARPARGRLDL